MTIFIHRRLCKQEKGFPIPRARSACSHSSLCGRGCNVGLHTGTMTAPLLHWLAVLSIVRTCTFAFTNPVTFFSTSWRSSNPAKLSTYDTCIGDLNASVPEGRVRNITQWLSWSDESLKRLSNDGRGGLYDRINIMLQQSSSDDNANVASTTTPQGIHSCERFAVLSHGNQTDPIYNYANSAGFLVFRWPEEKYYKLPSRYSAPAGAARQTREMTIENAVAQDVTYIDLAVRVRYPNDTVTLRDAVLWNVYDDDGNRVGQTVLFDKALCSYSDDDGATSR